MLKDALDYIDTLDVEARKRLVGYLNTVKDRKTRAQEAYLRALSEYLGIEIVSEVLTKNVQEIEFRNREAFLYILAEYVFVGNGDEWELRKYTGIDFDEAYEILENVKNRTKHNDRELLVKQYSSFESQELLSLSEKLVKLENENNDIAQKVSDVYDEMDPLYYDIDNNATEMGYLDDKIEQYGKITDRLYYAMSIIKNKMRYINSLKIKVVGASRTGKSTLINSLLRDRIVPTSPTEKITKVYSNGCVNIMMDAFDKKGDLMQHNYTHLNDEEMMELHKNKEISEIVLERIVPFDEKPDVYPFYLIDTPGYSDILIDEYINTSSKTIYICTIDPTKIGDPEEIDLLSKLKEKAGIGQGNRVLFVVTKFDGIKPNGGSIFDILANVRDYLEALGFEEPEVYPISALLALDTRVILSYDLLDKNSEWVKETIARINMMNGDNELHLEKYAPLSDEARDDMDTFLEWAKEDDDEFFEVILHSGITIIEDRILEIIREDYGVDKVERNFEE